MLVFVDESGDQGLSRRFGSSALFVLTAVIFVDPADAYECSERIGQLRKELFADDVTEFKFNKTSRDRRVRFFHEVTRFDFLYVSMAVDKCALLSSELQMQGPFYRFACKLLFDVAKSYINNSSITIDGTADREFRRELQTYLRSKINAGVRTIKQVKVESSSSNNLLQLADMVCGAVARSFRQDKEDRFLYRRLLNRRELEVAIWPKK